MDGSFGHHIGGQSKRAVAGMWGDAVVEVCGSFLLIASIFSVK
jgi:hypothetical protein